MSLTWTTPFCQPMLTYLRQNPKSQWGQMWGEVRILQEIQRMWNAKSESEGWFKQTESESTYSHLSPCLLFCVSQRQELIGQLSACAPPAARYWELLHCRASSYPVGNLSFCQRKGFSPPTFFSPPFAKSTFLKQIQHKPAIWYIQGAKCSIYNISKSLAYSFGEISLITINKQGPCQNVW